MEHRAKVFSNILIYYIYYVFQISTSASLAKQLALRIQNATILLVIILAFASLDTSGHFVKVI